MIPKPVRVSCWSLHRSHEFHQASIVAAAFVLFLLSACWGLVLADGSPPGKLVIVRAVYGDLPAGNQTDVTEKIAGMVKDNFLTVDATNDNFGDPAEGTGKSLQVDYTVDGVARTRTVGEKADADDFRISIAACDSGGVLR